MRNRYRANSRANGSVVPDPMSLIRAFESEANPSKPVRPSPLAASTISGLPLDLLDRLRSFPLFQSAPDSFLAAIGSHLRPQLHQPHDDILTEGDHAKAMYWLVRGAVRVTSRDGESTYAELKPGAFFGEIGILMDIPRTATIKANMRSLVVRLNKEDLKMELPNYPEVERAIMDEAKERLSILERKKKEIGPNTVKEPSKVFLRNGKRTRDTLDGDVEMGDAGTLRDGEVTSFKKRKSPSPGLAEAAALSVFGSGGVSVRLLLKELPLFSSLPPDILHFIGLNAQPLTFPPFTDIIKQGSQGRDVYFIVKGEVEVVAAEPQENGHATANMNRRKSIAGTAPTSYREGLVQQVKARLRAGQYFGEVTSLSLAPRRTATVRSISSVECLMISGDVLNELWQKCSPNLRNQVETVAKQRLGAKKDGDTEMKDAPDTPDIDELAIGPRTPRKKSVYTVTFNDVPTAIDTPLTPTRMEEKVIEPYDPDPFLNVDLDNIRSRSRRGSLAPPTPDSSQSSSNDYQSRPQSPNGGPLSPSPFSKHSTTPPEPAFAFKRPRILRRPSRFNTGLLPDALLLNIFQHLDVAELMRIRLVSMHWLRLASSPDILHTLDLSKYNRRITDQVLTDIICPFAGTRPRVVDMSNCFHVTDEGFAALASTCAPGVLIWKMKSVWDITGPAVLEMVNKAKELEEVDLSNCRKVGDNLLARVVGWVVPELPPAVLLAQRQQQSEMAMNGRRSFGGVKPQQPPPQPLPPGTVVGCPKLKRLTLSYCKHITDRSMAHIAVHAANRLEQIDLTRCTTITDVGFQHWSVYPFPRLTKLCLADCTYLTDNAVVYLCNAAKGLRVLDLVSSLTLFFYIALFFSAVILGLPVCPPLKSLGYFWT
ncbi:cyclic nucleotide-binding domain-containing protein [Delitschia confertaspora ATCC 74209]|uniref:Cyclic nucleotide-binding domain-containing protein n=1 Tax=Delitschia confertaspora ATCC 74209 TaxID=1513339 RepID=A0A9P4JBG8_9PLEO|nr:cyclic nucleotide-binding domain-containing protein [Delitschia confertaspora ATCC 74209]